MLKLNPDKTEFIVFRSTKQLQGIKSFFSKNILDNLFTPSNKVKNLGVMFDSPLVTILGLSANHVTIICVT